MVFGQFLEIAALDFAEFAYDDRQVWYELISRIMIARIDPNIFLLVWSDGIVLLFSPLPWTTVNLYS